MWEKTNQNMLGGGLKLCPQILCHSSFQKVKLNSSPLRCALFRAWLPTNRIWLGVMQGNFLDQDTGAILLPPCSLSCIRFHGSQVTLPVEGSWGLPPRAKRLYHTGSRSSNSLADRSIGQQPDCNLAKTPNPL